MKINPTKNNEKIEWMTRKKMLLGNIWRILWSKQVEWWVLCWYHPL